MREKGLFCELDERKNKNMKSLNVDLINKEFFSTHTN